MKILVVCSAGVGTSLMLKQRLQATLPENDYSNCGFNQALEEVSGGDYDVIITFNILEDRLKDILPQGTNVKTIEGYNDAARELFQEYIES